MNPPNPYPVPPSGAPPLGPPLSRTAKFFESPLGIIILTLTVAGPLTIPLVWRSTQMNRNTKWAMTVGISIFSVFVLWLAWITFQYMMMAVHNLEEATQINI